MLLVKKSRRRGNLDKGEEAERSVSEVFQLSFTREEKVGSVSNLKGLEDFGAKGSVISIMGQWLDLTLGRWWILEVRKISFQSALPNPLSNRSLILFCHIGLFVVHVK